MNVAPSFGRTVTAGAIAIVFLLLSCAGPSPVQADQRREPSPGRRPRPPTYDAAIKEGQTIAQDVLSQDKASAITIALVARRRVIWSQAFGLADREAGKAATTKTMFGIGSVSKMFATIAAMKLVDKGSVDLDTPLIEYLPDFRMASAVSKNSLSASAGTPSRSRACWRSASTAGPRAAISPTTAQR
jgi:CubicO group peptidase (beta-lactamase class C family)